MNVNRLTRLAVLLAATICLAPALAQPPVTLPLPVDFTGEVTHLGYGQGNVLDRIEIIADPFAVDLGTLDAMAATLAAPAGAAYAVNVPAGESGNLLVSLNWAFGSNFGADETWPVSVSLLGVAAPAPVLQASEAGGRQAGNQVFASAGFAYSQSFSFTGFQIDITGPFSSGGNLTYTDLQSTVLATLSEPAKDPGQFVTVIPEPATMGLLFIGGLALLRRKRGYSGQARLRRASADETAQTRWLRSATK
jgi:hypothetical protein